MNDKIDEATKDLSPNRVIRMRRLGLLMTLSRLPRGYSVERGQHQNKGYEYDRRKLQELGLATYTKAVKPTTFGCCGPSVLQITEKGKEYIANLERINGGKLNSRRV